MNYILKYIIALFCFVCMLSQTVLSQEKETKEENKTQEEKKIQEEKDFYAQIASMDIHRTDERKMEDIDEVDLPQDKQLNWSDSKKHRFNPMDKITTKEEMLEGLSGLQTRYLPFLKDIAPEMKEVRSEMRIAKMQFRYETEADKKDFGLLLRGEGEWKEIDMPYYHGQQGPLTAWYRVEIDVTEEMLSKPSLMIHFNGSDYYTDAFINGHHLGHHEGMLGEFEFNMKKYTNLGKNVILVKVCNDYSLLGSEGKQRRWGNKLSASNSPGWDDPFTGWSNCPHGFGIYQNVYIVSKGSPYIADIFCRPLFDHKAVELWVEIDLENGDLADDFMIKYSMFGQNFETTVVKDEAKKVSVVGGRILEKYIIRIPEDKFKVWSPDTPWLYQMQVTLYDKEGVGAIDAVKQQFGMRKFEMKKDSKPKGRFYLNNEEIRLRGTNTMGFLQLNVMRHDWDRLRDDLLLAKLTNMNFIRTTQRIVQKEVYEYADRLGIMMQADLPLFAYINQKQYTEVIKQASGIERVIRNHPSVIMMSYLNESMAEMQPHAISRYAYERLFEALDVVVENENPDRVVKYVDGDYQAPNDGYPDHHCYNIWYDNHYIGIDEMNRGLWKHILDGWMYGCGEFGAEGLDPVDLMKRRYPKEWLKLEDDGVWTPKNIRGKYIAAQTYGMHTSWFEPETTIEDWVEVSHAYQKWGVSTVARAFRRMPRLNSFAVHLFIDAWPNGWMKAIIDNERTPKPVWFAYRDALTPLSIQVETERTAFFSGDKNSFQIWVCNDTQEEPDAELRYQLEYNGKVVNSGIAKADIPVIEDAVRFQGFVTVNMPKVNKRTKLTVRAMLFDKKTNSVIHEEACDVIVHPKLAKTNKRVCLIGDSKDAQHLVKTMEGAKKTGLDELRISDVIIISEDVDKEQLNKISKAVEAGAHAIVLNEMLESELIQELLDVKSVKKDDRWVVFRNRTHPWVKNTNKKDLFYAYSSVKNRPRRFYCRAFDAPGFTPVLTQVNRSVLAEKSCGKGKWILCGMELDGMLDVNPVLSQIIRKGL